MSEYPKQCIAGKRRKMSIITWVCAHNKGTEHSWLFCGRAQSLFLSAIHRISAFFSPKVCFHCREPGHGVADCPAVLESQDMGTGICYRCGSTEHDIGKCRAKVDPAAGPFPYAKCFICGEMGHLSRSCPDNPKGLYAEGECVTVGRWTPGLSADHEDVTATPALQRTQPKAPKVVTF
uniref:Zinc finger CCHC-type containing 9 n=1 Tax=Malurus cyaneus samueli TaxID=2593467 RepID=A0A8C5TU33_9PASS